MSSRRIEDLLPEVANLFHEFSMRMHDEGLQFIVTCTYRSQSEQDLLWAKGRTEPGPKVTWTKRSKHTDKKAFDIAMVNERGAITWNALDYIRAGEIGEEVGLKWLGPKDSAHFELREA